MYTDTSKCDMAGEIGINELGSRITKLSSEFRFNI